MSHSEVKELLYTGLTLAEYFNGDSCKCIFCKGKDGDKEVAELNGDAVEVRIEIEELVFDNQGFRVCYPVCLKCQKFFEGLISLFDGGNVSKIMKQLLPFFTHN